MQFFGDKYGSKVRVVQIGGTAKSLDGYSMELCGGTHVRNTNEIGSFKIKSEGAIASGIRRIEALCGSAADAYIAEQAAEENTQKNALLEKLASLNESLAALDVTGLTAPKEASASDLKALTVDAEKLLKRTQASAATGKANDLLKSAKRLANGTQVLAVQVEAPDPNSLKTMVAHLAGQLDESLVLLAAVINGKVSICVQASPEAIDAGYNAGQIVREITAELGGKGGGKPNFAMGGAPDSTKLEALLANYLVD
jgi:alanyl-tRNA synthetase